LCSDGDVRSGAASLTARGVAIARSRIERPAWPTGDPGADDRLVATLAGDVPDEQRDRYARSGFGGWINARTHFFDDAVLRALRAGIDQIVVLGAGYDGRALRYRTPDVRFFEVDHPGTQADKRRRLREVGASVDGIVFVAADFTEPGLGERLAIAGHDAASRSLFVCEGVLRYLPEHWYRGLLRATAERAARSSELSVSVSTRDGQADDRERAREQALAESGEAVLTVPPAATALGWLAQAGWDPVSITDARQDEATDRRGRLLVRAVRNS
jgi:methyltransferase (TIGR00027 family)